MITLEVFAVILALVGIAGCVLPCLAGPPISWVGLLLLYIAKIPDPISPATLWIFLGVTVIVTALDYILPPSLTRAMGGHKAAATGATIGMIAGMFLTPIGMIAGSLIGAFIAEFIVEDNGVWGSFKASVGTYIGFILTTGIKLIVSGWIFLIIITHII